MIVTSISRVASINDRPIPNNYRPGIWLMIFIILVLSGCQKKPATPPELNVNDILGGQNTEGFERALDIRQFRFPDDHGSHNTFRNEWWYLTGNVSDDLGRFYGYQVTFFRTAVAPPTTPKVPSQTQNIEASSNWASNDIWMAHTAITDINKQVHYNTQRFSRANPGLAGAKINPLAIWLEDWKLSSTSNDFPWTLNVKTPEFAIELELTPVKNPVLQGNKGLSQKSAEPGNASYYYSFTRMATRGALRLQNDTIEVNGLSWFDREWSTSALDQNQSGWNWFSLQLDSGDDLMYYQLIDIEGLADLNSQGKWIDSGGKSLTIKPKDITLEILEEWQSDDGKRYPTRWRMDYKAANKSWIIAAVMEDQYMNLAVKYWEGAVAVYDAESRDLVGRGYLEMTRTR
jgi:predicted secreted hydrolase